MKMAGCWEIHYGIESGSQRLLDLIQKGITLEQVREAVKMVEGVGDVKVELTFEPPWDKDMLSESALLELGLL